MTEPLSTIDGYVSDSLYPSLLHRYFQIPWIDAVLAMQGVVPPRFEQNSFTQVDLGCGDGLGLILTASSHPQGQFIGIDGAPDHIARGREVIKTLGLTNIRLVCASFSGFNEQLDGAADYVTAQGVLSWITTDNRESLLTLAANLLKPGGAFCVGYNAFPGWHEGASFQALVRTVAAEKTGSSTERFEAALEQIRSTGLIKTRVWEWLEKVGNSISTEYFAHEYLNTGWAPCWSGDVITQLGARGMAYIGQSANERLREDYCYKPNWRKHLGELTSMAAREVAADIYCHTWFRRDIYIKTPALGFEPNEAKAFRLKSWWKLKETLESDPKLEVKTFAGTLDFDTEAAKAILATLANGPQNLASIMESSGIEPDDLLDSIDALFIAKYVTPVDAPTDDALANKCNDWFEKNRININGRASKYGALGAGC